MTKMIISEDSYDYEIAVAAVFDVNYKLYGHVMRRGIKIVPTIDPYIDVQKYNFVAPAMDRSGNTYKIEWPILGYNDEKEWEIVDWHDYEVEEV